MATAFAPPTSPFLSIWIEPRTTIRRIVATDPTRYVLVLAATGPAMQALGSEWAHAINKPQALGMLWPFGVALWVALQAILGVVALYGFASLYGWTGRMLGGHARSVEMRAALAWAQVPIIVAAAIGIVGALAGVPFPEFAKGGMPTLPRSFIELGLMELVFGWWGFVISLHTMGEVQGFSAWRALGAALLGLLIMLLILGVSVLFLIMMIRTMLH
ncbi:MAG TPA: Yip1 family protein [Candidatus Binataceae bacterium]